MSRPFDPAQGQRGLFDALIEAAKAFGLMKPILEDQDRKPLTYRDLIAPSFALGRKIAARTRRGERVALLLPTSAGAVVTFFALQAFARVPTMLNFTSGPRNLKAALGVAEAKLILTSRRFIAQAKLEELVEDLQTVAEVVYLEDIRASIGLPDRLYALAAGAAPQLFRKPVKPSDIGVILFTSGSFAAPRGVVLTQANLVSNALQVACHIDIDADWVMFKPDARLPLPRPDRRGHPAPPRWHEGFRISLSPTYENRHRIDSREQGDDPAVDRYLHGPVRPRGRAGRPQWPEDRGLRGGEGPRDHPDPDGREVRSGAASGGLWRDRGPVR